MFYSSPQRHTHNKEYIMDKDQIIEWLSNNLSLESRTICDSYGTPMGAEIKIEMFHDKENLTLAQTEIYFD